MAEVTPGDRKMTYVETERGLVDLIVNLSRLRARSDPHIFESLWQEKIMRIDEIEDEVPEEVSTATDTADTANNAAVAQGMIPINDPINTSMSNEPFNSRGNPIKDPNSIIPPTLPQVMSIWISTAYMPSITLSDDGLPNHVQVFAPDAKAYHWIDAPVENLDMSRFIEGVNYRVTTPASKVLGYILSYGWNVCLSLYPQFAVTYFMSSVLILSTGHVSLHLNRPLRNPRTNQASRLQRACSRQGQRQREGGCC